MGAGPLTEALIKISARARAWLSLHQCRQGHYSLAVSPGMELVVLYGQHSIVDCRIDRGDI